MSNEAMPLLAAKDRMLGATKARAAISKNVRTMRNRLTGGKSVVLIAT